MRDRNRCEVRVSDEVSPRAGLFEQTSEDVPMPVFLSNRANIRLGEPSINRCAGLLGCEWSAEHPRIG